MKNLAITAGSFLSLLGKSHPKNGFSETQRLVLKANAILLWSKWDNRTSEIIRVFWCFPKKGTHNLSTFALWQFIDLMAKPISGLCKGGRIVPTLCMSQHLDLKAKRNFELCKLTSEERGVL